MPFKIKIIFLFEGLETFSQLVIENDDGTVKLILTIFVNFYEV